MPGWHERTAKLAAEGKLAVAGIVQEQHGDRAALFMQWKGMRWPVMVDSLNLLGVRGVPTTLLIDESGVIRAVNPKPEQFERFLAAAPVIVADVEAPTFVAPDKATKLAVATLSGGDLGAAIEALAAQTAAHSDDAAAQFRLGVLRRARYDSAARRPDDFAAAVAAWGAALEAEPGQYIWRRRIQQYGPRLDKPYPFYDWVPTARAAIVGRGEDPVPLAAEPSGAEIARPSRGIEDPIAAIGHPDPDGKLPLDTGALIEFRAVAVPSTDPKSRAYRLHLEFEPSAEQRAHWNNESGESRVWVQLPEGWQSGALSLPLRDPDAGKRATNLGTRHVEFELRAGGGGSRDPGKVLKGSALYYVCEGAQGTCQYLRRNFEIVLP